MNSTLATTSLWHRRHRRYSLRITPIRPRTLLQVLTWLTFRVEDLAVGVVGEGTETRHELGRGLAIWLGLGTPA